MELCIEWKLSHHKAWNYMTGTRGKSRADLNVTLREWRSKQRHFQFRIIAWEGV